MVYSCKYEDKLLYANEGYDILTKNLVHIFM